MPYVYCTIQIFHLRPYLFFTFNTYNNTIDSFLFVTRVFKVLTTYEVLLWLKDWQDNTISLMLLGFPEIKLEKNQSRRFLNLPPQMLVTNVMTMVIYRRQIILLSPLVSVACLATSLPPKKRSPRMLARMMYFHGLF